MFSWAFPQWQWNSDAIIKTWILLPLKTLDEWLYWESFYHLCFKTLVFLYYTFCQIQEAVILQCMWDMQYIVCNFMQNIMQSVLYRGHPTALTLWVVAARWGHSVGSMLDTSGPAHWWVQNNPCQPCCWWTNEEGGATKTALPALTLLPRVTTDGVRKREQWG